MSVLLWKQPAEYIQMPYIPAQSAHALTGMAQAILVVKPEDRT